MTKKKTGWRRATRWSRTFPIQVSGVSDLKSLPPSFSSRMSAKIKEARCYRLIGSCITTFAIKQFLMSWPMSEHEIPDFSRKRRNCVPETRRTITPKGIKPHQNVPFKFLIATATLFRTDYATIDRMPWSAHKPSYNSHRKASNGYQEVSFPTPSLVAVATPSRSNLATIGPITPRNDFSMVLVSPEVIASRFFTSRVFITPASKTLVFAWLWTVEAAVVVFAA